MDHLQTVKKRLYNTILLSVFLGGAVVVGVYYLAEHYKSVSPVLALGAAGIVLLGLSLLLASKLSRYSLIPLQAVWQAVLGLNPTDKEHTAAPDITHLRLGQELVTSLTGQIYQLAKIAEHSQDQDKQEASSLQHNFIANNLPLPLLVLDATETIQFANQAASQYIGIEAADIIGKNVYMILDMSFPSESTFDNWLKAAKQDSAISTESWERVRLNVRDNHPLRLFDLAAYYNKGNAQNAETLLVLFDHTKQYSQDDQAISFMALGVHELRTPLTLLRGYIEVFEEELKDKVDKEMMDFMEKMNVASQQLTAFVNNILNVARVDDDQLQLQLQSGDWASILTKTVELISLRAKVRGINIACSVAPDLPPVGVDRLSIQEVINNLIDNAIKYSGTSKVIHITAQLNKEGVVETTVQDYGLGIDASVLPNLFTKFYRDHKNRAQIGGTGLGLYLSKAIVTAHGGNMWVRSKEGEGSTFGFTLVPYSQLNEERKDPNEDIVREAHGWIKNHSLYRR